MTTHAEILSLLHKHAPGRVPRDFGGATLVQVDGGRYLFGRYGVETLDAHPHIELAGLGAVREWCKSQRRSLLIADGQREDDIAVALGAEGLPGEMPDELGSGPTLSSAILAALRGIFGEKE